MNYAGFVLRRERLRRNWSQEGLCRDICTVSYLSKIEQGKVEPSGEVLKLLMERMNLPWREIREEDRELVESLYESVFSYDEEFGEQLEQLDVTLRCSSLGPDILLLEQFAKAEGQPLEDALEGCMNGRQLGLQRLLQGRYGEAARIYPRAFFLYMEGDHCYRDGKLTNALECFQDAYRLAAQEGCPRIMLYCKLLMGNCYSNLLDLEAMENHYRVARRLAKALGKKKELASIAYNTAATQLEAGAYSKAYAYFRKLEDPGRMELHKLAICCEKLGRMAEAMDALNRAYTVKPEGWMPEGLDVLILDVVRLRLTDPEYLQKEEYGDTLLSCFDRCRKELSSGYGVFHLPWVVEWYEANRQYKQALAILRDFPEKGRINSL